MLELRIDAGPSPERATQVRLPEWEGPLGLLLSLIEARRLDVLDVPLGSLAEAYLDALASIEVDRMGHISSFVAIAGQLILIKSRAMLPRPPTSDDGGPLGQIAKKHGATPSQVALAWLLWRSPVMLPIPGTSKVKHLEENIAAAGLRIPEEEMRQI